MLKKRWPQCHVGLAESAGNALLQMEFSHYDMVLINISLPQTDGLAATHQIRAHAMPEIRATPVVGLAAKSEASERHRCLASGMQWVLFKPLEPEVFFTAITAHLGKGSSSCVQ
jgi:CheY-like chemotaxis protein